MSSMNIHALLETRKTLEIESGKKTGTTDEDLETGRKVGRLLSLDDRLYSNKPIDEFGNETEIDELRLNQIILFNHFESFNELHKDNIQDNI